jgi:hypothetical protein
MIALVGLTLGLLSVSVLAAHADVGLPALLDSAKELFEGAVYCPEPRGRPWERFSGEPCTL